MKRLREILKDYSEKGWELIEYGESEEFCEEVTDQATEAIKSLLLAEQEIMSNNCINYTGKPCAECEEYSGCIIRAKALKTAQEKKLTEGIG